MHNYVNRKEGGSGFVLVAGDRVIVDATNVSDLVDGIIDAKRKGLPGGIYTGQRHL